MRMIVVTVAIAALLCVPVNGVTGQDADGPFSSAELLAEYATEEVEPGVYRVVNDGVRDLASRNNFDIEAGQDGGVWLLRKNRLLRLGTPGAYKWATRQPRMVGLEVAPDGTVWAVEAERRPPWTGQLRSHDGKSWTTHLAKSPVMGVAAGTDGTISVWWQLEDGDPDAPMRIGYVDGDLRRSIGQYDGIAEVAISGSGDLWVRSRSNAVQRYRAGEWQPFDCIAWRLDAGADDTVWGVGACADSRGPEPGNGDRGLIRFDEAGWTEWSWSDAGVQPVLQGLASEPFEVAPDGSLWVGWPQWRTLQEGEWVDTCYEWDTWDKCGGVRRFDGAAWDQYLPGVTVKAMDIAADGSVWVLAGEREGRDLYVITPEAVAASPRPHRLPD